MADPDHAHTCTHSQAGLGYGYQGKLNSILKTEFPQLQDRVYADHAGATLYTKSQIEAVQQVCSVLHGRLVSDQLDNVQTNMVCACATKKLSNDEAVVMHSSNGM